MENKKMKLWKKIVLVILALFILFVILTLRKFTIMTNLDRISANYGNKTNYIAELYGIQGNNVIIMKSLHKDGNHLTTIQTNLQDLEQLKKTTLYRNGEDTVEIVETKDAKTALLNDDMIVNIQVPTFSSFIFVADSTIMQKLGLAVVSRISTEEYDDKEYFVIEIEKGWKIWVEKDTGLITREINGNLIAERNYEFDIVKDEDIIKPDISDCEIRQNND